MAALFGSAFMQDVDGVRYGCFGCGDLHFQAPGIEPWVKEVE